MILANQSRSEVAVQLVSKNEHRVSFVGRLLQLQYKSGQPCAQLVFKTTDGTRLALSRNLHLLQSLTVGNTYYVRGAERELASKLYVHEPTITSQSFTGRIVGGGRLVAMSAVVCLALGGILLAGTHLYAEHMRTTAVTQRTKLEKPLSQTDSAAAAVQPTVPSDSTPATDEAPTPAPEVEEQTPTANPVNVPTIADPPTTVVPPAPVSPAPDPTAPEAPPVETTPPATDQTPPVVPPQDPTTPPVIPPADPPKPANP